MNKPLSERNLWIVNEVFKAGEVNKLHTKPFFKNYVAFTGAATVLHPSGIRTCALLDKDLVRLSRRMMLRWAVVDLPSTDREELGIRWAHAYRISGSGEAWLRQQLSPK